MLTRSVVFYGAVRQWRRGNIALLTTLFDFSMIEDAVNVAPYSLLPVNRQGAKVR